METEKKPDRTSQIALGVIVLSIVLFYIGLQFRPLEVPKKATTPAPTRTLTPTATPTPTPRPFLGPTTGGTGSSGATTLQQDQSTPNQPQNVNQSTTINQPPPANPTPQPTPASPQATPTPMPTTPCTVIPIINRCL